jgi:plasmid stabilization system protein ParE
MKFRVFELTKAQWDKRRIFAWLFERSPQGAAAWLEAYDQMVARLSDVAGSLPVAPENSDLDLEVRQILFKTRHGRVYRAICHIDGENVHILRVRGPGQPPLSDDVLR